MMKNSWRMGLVVACIPVLAACSDNDRPDNVSPARFSEVVIFGDSLSDGGSYNPTTADDDPGNDSPTGFAFTTNPGVTWAVAVANKLNVKIGPNQQVNFGVVGNGGAVQELGGNNYAEGGARILTDAPNAGVVEQDVPGVGRVSVQLATSRSIASQISDYLSEHDQRFHDKQLVLIQGGPNDFFDFLDEVAADPSQAARAPAVISSTVTAMTGQVARLRGAGARNILYANMPDLGVTILFRDTPLAGLATSLSVAYNDAVAAVLNAWNVPVFDTQALIRNLVASPAQFGFTDTTTPACNSFTTPGDRASLSALICSPATLVEPNADRTHVFSDDVHPTTRTHSIWADQVVTLLTTVVF